MIAVSCDPTIISNDVIIASHDTTVAMYIAIR